MSNKMQMNWADDDEIEDEKVVALPPPTTVYENGFKVMTEFKLNDEDKMVKVVRTYKIEKKLLSKTVAERRKWAKFGDASNDPPGPNPANTFVAEDVFMQFLSSKEEDNKVEEDSLDKLKSMAGKGVVKCRNCNGDHWTSKCPFKDTVLVGGMFVILNKSFVSIKC